VKKDVDARHKAGHDAEYLAPASHSSGDDRNARETMRAAE
jgi:hypothetical protein